MVTLLLVTMSGRGPTLRALLESGGYEVITAASVPEATRMLAGICPDLLLSELHLGEFNGLNLVLRHQQSHPTMRAVILSKVYDPVLSADAQNCGAVYITEPVDDERLLEVIARTLQQENPQRRWPRKRPINRLRVRMSGRPARVIDMSYGGLRLEATHASEIPPRFQVVFDDLGVAIEARPVWSRRGPAGSWWYGADVSNLGRAAEQQWRQLVDSVHAA